MFWSATYAALGYIFSNQLDRVAAHVAAGARWQRFVREFKLARITPEQLRGKLNAGEDILLWICRAVPVPVPNGWQFPVQFE